MTDRIQQATPMPHATSPTRGTGNDEVGAVLAAALAYARAGYRIHPCRAEDKRPLTAWSSMASTDANDIRMWWRHWPDALIGVCTGNGLVVVDDDRGQAEPEEDMAETLTCKTRSRGWHHWFRSDRPAIGNRVGIIPGVDIRGAGGYVIAPPSPGWEWWNPTTGIQELPGWVVTLMAAQGQRRRGWGAGFKVATTPVGEGQRNDYIARFAGYVLRLELATTMAELLDLCRGENERIVAPPLPDTEIRQTAASIWRADQRRND